MHFSNCCQARRTKIATRSGRFADAVRLVPEGSLTGLEEGRLKLKDGEAGLTLHTIDGTIPQLRRAIDRSLEAFFELLPGAEDEDRDE